MMADRHCLPGGLSDRGDRVGNINDRSRVAKLKADHQIVGELNATARLVDRRCLGIGTGEEERRLSRVRIQAQFRF